MATWKDGAAYAPVERPDGFATPSVDPLPVGEPYTSGTPGAETPPARFDAVEQPPLESFGTGEQTHRDPREGFAVSAAAMTTAPGAPSGPRDPRTPFATENYERNYDDGAPDAPPVGLPLTTTAPPPALAAAPAPAPWGPPQQRAPLPPAPMRAQPPMPYPPGGMSQPARPQLQQQQQQQRRLAQVAGALCLGGFLFQAAVPFLLIAAGVLGLRTRVLTNVAGPISLGLGVLFLFGQLGLGTLGEGSALGGLVSLVLAFVFFISGMRKL